jgi:hypothetical protein
MGPTTAQFKRLAIDEQKSNAAPQNSVLPWPTLCFALPDSLRKTPPQFVPKNFCTQGDCFSRFAIDCTIVALQKKCLPGSLNPSSSLPDAAKAYLLQMQNQACCAGLSFSFIVAMDKRLRGDKRDPFSFIPKTQVIAFQIIEEMVLQRQIFEEHARNRKSSRLFLTHQNGLLHRINMQLLQNLAHIHCEGEIIIDLHHARYEEELSKALLSPDVDLIKVGLASEKGAGHSLALFLQPECALFDMNLGEVQFYKDRLALLRFALVYFKAHKEGVADSVYYRYLILQPFKRLQLAPTAAPNLPTIEEIQ